MLKTLHLTNFQCHKNLKLEFSSGLTSIQGFNDSGKSSIVRALYWVFYSDPAGDWMRRIDKSGEMLETTAKVVFEDGTIISRIKGNKINRYTVNGDDFDNFGFQVPEQVAKVLKMNEFKTNKASFNLNVSMQDQPTFLIHESAPVKASVLDVLTGNSILQKGISEFNKESLAVSKDIVFHKEAIEISERDLLKIPNLAKIQKKLDKADVFQKAIAKRESEIQELETIQNRFRRSKAIKEGFADLDKINVTELLNLHNGIHEFNSSVSELKRLKDKYTKFQKVKAPVVDASALNDLYVAYQNSLANLQAIKLLDDRRSNRLMDVENFGDTIGNLELEIAEIEKLNPPCPTCGKTMK